MEIVIDTHLLWNLLLTFVLAPLGFLVRSILSEQKRIDILVNKTREEVASRFVTKEELALSIDRVIDRLDKLDEKMDKIIQI